MYVASVVFVLFAPSIALKAATHNVVERQPQGPMGGDISHDDAEWEAFSKTIRAPVIKKLWGRKMCLHPGSQKFAVPEFYLLGSEKAGTTTFAADVMSLGFKSAKGQHQKELHSFDFHCNFHTRQHRPKHEWMSNGAPMDVCKKMTDSEKEHWAKQFARCESAPMASLIDLTPSNLRIPGLPLVMADVYGYKMFQLTFAIMLREPLSRFQSGWYNLGGKLKFETTFKEHVNSVLSMAENMDEQGIGQDYFLDEFFRSMYSISMGRWLDLFRPTQFLIIPSSLYLKNTTFKSSVLQKIGGKMSNYVDTRAIQTQPHRHMNKGSHPPLSEDLDSSQIATLRAKYYDPTNRDLFEMLAEAIPDSLSLLGFEGRKTPSPSEVEAFLISSW